jgi:hypothetical protein
LIVVTDLDKPEAAELSRLSLGLVNFGLMQEGRHVAGHHALTGATGADARRSRNGYQ